MKLSKRIEQHFIDHRATLEKTLATLARPIEQAIALLNDTISSNGKVLACGNGGSAADSQHFIAELVGRFERDRLPLAGVALTTDSSILTAIGNDYHFDHVFDRQVLALGQPGDLLVAMSTSGNSTNVVNAIKAAHDNDLNVIALTGKDGGLINDLLQPNDVHLCIPESRTMRIQEMHILLLHIICDGLDANILGDNLE